MDTPPNQAGPAPDPLCSTAPDSADHDDVQPGSGEGETTERARPAAARPSQDPRAKYVLSNRDSAALMFIAGMGVVAQYQLHMKVFPGLSEVVVSRCVHRLARRLGLIDVFRWNRIGLNLLKLRTAGSSALADIGVSNERIFLARWPTPSGFAHRLWLIDTILALSVIQPEFESIPCWALRRRFASSTTPIPDILAVRRDIKRVLAVEVDRGGENLRRVLVPKLESLQQWLTTFAPEAKTSILVLTQGDRRAAALRQRLAAKGITAACNLLPDAIGRAAVAALIERFGGVFSRREDLKGRKSPDIVVPEGVA